MTVGEYAAQSGDTIFALGTTSLLFIGNAADFLRDVRCIEQHYLRVAKQRIANAQNDINRMSEAHMKSDSSRYKRCLEEQMRLRENTIALNATFLASQTPLETREILRSCVRHLVGQDEITVLKIQGMEQGEIWLQKQYDAAIVHYRLEESEGAEQPKAKREWK